MRDRSGEITTLLARLSAGQKEAMDDLIPVVYAELRRVAARCIAAERPGHTLQPTALVHEVYFRLIGQKEIEWKNRAQFVGLAAVMMRRILVNHARDRAAGKRGGDMRKVSLSDVETAARPQDVDIIVLHEALDQLCAIDPRKSRIVELKFFGGLTTSEIAEVLQLSPATIERDWSFARAWLYDAIGGEV